MGQFNKDLYMHVSVGEQQNVLTTSVIIGEYMQMLVLSMGTWSVKDCATGNNDIATTTEMTMTGARQVTVMRDTDRARGDMMVSDVTSQSTHPGQGSGQYTIVIFRQLDMAMWENYFMLT